MRATFVLLMHDYEFVLAFVKTAVHTLSVRILILNVFSNFINSLMNLTLFAYTLWNIRYRFRTIKLFISKMGVKGFLLPDLQWCILGYENHNRHKVSSAIFSPMFRS